MKIGVFMYIVDKCGSNIYIPPIHFTLSQSDQQKVNNIFFNNNPNVFEMNLNDFKEGTEAVSRFGTVFDYNVFKMSLMDYIQRGYSYDNIIEELLGSMRDTGTFFENLLYLKSGQLIDSSINQYPNIVCNYNNIASILENYRQQAFYGKKTILTRLVIPYCVHSMTVMFDNGKINIIDSGNFFKNSREFLYNKEYFNNPNINYKGWCHSISVVEKNCLHKKIFKINRQIEQIKTYEDLNNCLSILMDNNMDLYNNTIDKLMYCENFESQKAQLREILINDYISSGKINYDVNKFYSTYYLAPNRHKDDIVVYKLKYYDLKNRKKHIDFIYNNNEISQKKEQLSYRNDVVIDETKSKFMFLNKDFDINYVDTNKNFFSNGSKKYDNNNFYRKINMLNKKQRRFNCCNNVLLNNNFISNNFIINNNFNLQQQYDKFQCINNNYNIVFNQYNKFIM